MTREVILPWPPSALNPNKRLHWAQKRKHAKAYRDACCMLSKQAKLAVDWDGDIALWVDFFPPDRRSRDDDNLVAAFKSGRDGLADALGVDDKRFRVLPYLQITPYPLGYVRVRLTPMPKQEDAP